MTKRKNFIYLLMIVFIILSVFIKQRRIINARQKAIISSFSEWDQHGKPVVVLRAKKKDVPSYTKVTFWQRAPNVFKAYVSKDVRDQLKIGQEMLFKVDGTTFQGRISEIAKEISLDTGMYLVSAEFQERFNISGWKVAYAHTATIRDAINIPNEMIEHIEGQYFIWKIDKGRAVRQQIVVKQRNGYGAIVEQGVEEGDQLVVEGFNQLREGDTVNIIREYSEENIHG